VLIAASATAAVMLVILAVIFLTNYAGIVADADRMLAMLSENGGKMPLPDNRPDGRERPFGILFDEETPFRTRYFTVILEERGSMVLDLASIAAVGIEQAEQYALQVSEAGRERGFVEQYRYQMTGFGSGCMIVFLDCNMDLIAFWELIRSSLLIAAAGVAAVVVLLLLCAGRVVKPIADSYQRQRRFITDASHELKTPLTVIDTNTEVLEMTAGENQWTRSTRNQINRLTALTERLVMLSRLDEENAMLMSDFSLSDAVTESVEPFFALVQSGEKTLCANVEKHITCCGSEENIRRLVGILMENAFKYSGEQGRIAAELKLKGKTPVITVHNTAPGMKKGRHDELFERFYRADASRTAGGFGIGLSIAHAIVMAHKGRIHAIAEKENELTITVTL